MLLNTPAGVIDLRTGEVLPNDPGLQMTRITRAAPGSGCRRWLAFIARITGGDSEMAAYLQRIAGYCLTGRTDEQAFFFLHGSGANGKTVFLEVLADVLGSYARTAPLDTFMATRADRQQNDLAGLDGARMVIATETEAGRPWAEARIKAVTGGDRIAVRRLYGEFFETIPGYKLLIAGNHRPRLTGGGAGMARRLHLVPFDTVIPEHERDGRLREKLLGERDGILGWMLEGCRAWQDRGLAAAAEGPRGRRQLLRRRGLRGGLDRRGLRGRRGIQGDSGGALRQLEATGGVCSASIPAMPAISASGCALSVSSPSGPVRARGWKGVRLLPCEGDAA